jgi:hypothetical protein
MRSLRGERLFGRCPLAVLLTSALVLWVLRMPRNSFLANALAAVLSSIVAVFGAYAIASAFLGKLSVSRGLTVLLAAGVLAAAVGIARRRRRTTSKHENTVRSGRRVSRGGWRQMQTRRGASRATARCSHLGVRGARVRRADVDSRLACRASRTPRAPTMQARSSPRRSERSQAPSAIRSRSLSLSESPRVGSLRIITSNPLLNRAFVGEPRLADDRKWSAAGGHL